MGSSVADIEYIVLCRANMNIQYKHRHGTHEAIKVTGLYTTFSKVSCSPGVVQSSTRLATKNDGVFVSIRGLY